MHDGYGIQHDYALSLFLGVLQNMSTGEQVLYAEILRNGMTEYENFEIPYGKEEGTEVDIVKWLRVALQDPRLNVQLYTSEKRPTTEVCWRTQFLHVNTKVYKKEVLDRLRSFYLTINVTTRNGPVYREFSEMNIRLKGL